MSSYFYLRRRAKHLHALQVRFEKNFVILLANKIKILG